MADPLYINKGRHIVHCEGGAICPGRKVRLTATQAGQYKDLEPVNKPKPKAKPDGD